MKSAGLIVVVVATLFAGNSRAADAKPAAFPERLRAQAEEAQKMFDVGSYSEAERVYEAMRKAAPDNVWILSNLATVQIRLGKLKQAEAILRAAVAITPEDGPCHGLLGLSLYAQRKFDEAIVELKKAVAIDPKDARAHLHLAFCAAQKGWTEMAEKEFAIAAELDPAYKSDSARPAEADRHWPIGDYLTPLERSRLRLPPARPVR